MSRLQAPLLSQKVARQCRLLVVKTAKKYKIPPSHITAHIGSKSACRARYEVWVVMIHEMGIKRGKVAEMFNRHHRRVRASVLLPYR